MIVFSFLEVTKPKKRRQLGVKVKYQTIKYYSLRITLNTMNLLVNPFICLNNEIVLALSNSVTLRIIQVEGRYATKCL